MFQFNSFFKDQYQIALKEVSYKIIENSSNLNNPQISFEDVLSINNFNRQMEFEFCRTVSFEPESIYHLNVVFSAIVEFRDDVDIDNLSVDWEKELKDSPNPYLSNVICRTSNIISMLTSSYGQQPFITPPIFVEVNGSNE